jgi:hypothetical protein
MSYSTMDYHLITSGPYFTYIPIRPITTTLDIFQGTIAYMNRPKKGED